jgi:NADH-quinone oxidoreductase subunit H
MTDGGFHVSLFSWNIVLNMPHWLVVLIGMASFGVKVFLLCFVQLSIRWTVPRMRFDQLMELGWKGMLPLSIVNIIITAGFVCLSQSVAS